MNKALYFFLIILTFGCAQFVPPTGGPTDKKAPELLVSEPANKTINFKGNSLSLTFNEYVDISTLKQDLIIIPDPKSLYTAKLKDKTVKLVFDEKFADSTTYTFNFRNGIKDLNEKNPATNLKIVVSTGPKIDSLNIKGKVKDLHTKIPILEATVGLYKADTLPWNRKKPDYFIKTDSSGLFTFENIKNGKYFILAFTDRNNNLIYDQKNESVAFIRDSINLTKNIELDTMELFTANYFKNKIKKVISRETEFVIQLDKNFKEASINTVGKNLEKYTTNNDQLAEKLNMLRNHGASISEEQRHKGPKPYILPEFDMVGYNYRMTDIQGAVGVVQLKKLDTFIDERQKWADFYTQELSQIKWLKTPYIPQGYKHGWQSYVLMVDESIAPMKRNDLMEFLQQKGISTRPGTHAVHMLGFYAKTFNIKPSDFPGAYACNEYSMSIPLHNKMEADDFAYVVETLKSIN